MLVFFEGNQCSEDLNCFHSFGMSIPIHHPYMSDGKAPGTS